MSFVDIHPHFVSARNYDDVKTVVGLLKDPIDDDDFERPADAPFLPPACTSTIHITDSVGGLASTHSSVTDLTKMHRAKGNEGGVGAAGAMHAPFGDKTTDAARSPAHADLDDDDALLVLPSAPKLNVPPASATEFKNRRRASSFHQGPRKPKILCVWDVDDTLVATGVSGVRQNLVFRESELVSLFRSAGPDTRHLLLSQGSIDDVFEAGGRLRCIQKFVQMTPSAPGVGRGTKATTSSKEKKRKTSFSDMLRCGGGKQTKEQPSSSTSVTTNDRGGGRGRKGCSEGAGRTDETDMRRFAPGTVVVRLSSVHNRAEDATDSAFLTDATKHPTCARTSTVPLDEKAERMGRWLILRPEVWGITLASMNTIFPPSRNTAFVNGKVYRKMDVVWSLAMTGQWDSVFFIDNNLSEVGVVRYGMQMSDVLNLRSGREVWRLFQSEFLLLAASAKLREMEARYGRDITKPPPQPSADNTNSDTNKTVNAKDSGNSVGLSGELRVKSAATGSGDGTGESGELTPSKSTATSSTDSAARVKADHKDTHTHHNARAKPVGAGEIHVDVEEDIHIIHRPSAGDAAASSTSARSENLSLNSFPHQANTTSLLFPPSSSGSLPTTSSKEVDLVVVNLHMSCDAYRRVLTTARTNNEGQCALRREGSLPTRYVGQPVFIGDRSCTDEQYEALLKYFQEAESGLFQLMEEEMRLNGYVDMHISSKWIPRLYAVHAPIRKRPTFIPHMPQYYTAFFDEVEERVAKALQKHGGTSASCPLHSEAQRQYFTLQRTLTFIDPYLTGDLGRILFDIYMVDGNIPRSLAENLKKTLNRVRERITVKADHK